MPTLASPRGAARATRQPGLENRSGRSPLSQRQHRPPGAPHGARADGKPQRPDRRYRAHARGRANGLGAIKGTGQQSIPCSRARESKAERKAGNAMTDKLVQANADARSAPGADRSDEALDPARIRLAQVRAALNFNPAGRIRLRRQSGVAMCALERARSYEQATGRDQGGDKTLPPHVRADARCDPARPDNPSNPTDSPLGRQCGILVACIRGTLKPAGRSEPHLAFPWESLLGKNGERMSMQRRRRIEQGC